MKLNAIIIYKLTICLAWLLSACDSLVQDVPDSRVPQEPQKPVIVGFISPQDSLLAVNIKLTQTVLGSQPATNSGVSNALVTISEGSRFIALPFIQGSDGNYSAPARNFPIEAGKTYRLTVAMATGQILTSSATVPAVIPIQDIQFDSIGVNSNLAERYFLQVRWQDPAGISNYYRLQGTQSYVQTIPVGPNNQPQTTTIVQTINFVNQEGRYVVNDQNNDGNRFTSVRGFYQKRVAGYYVNNKPVLVPGGAVMISLLNTDKLYYDYHESLKRYSNSDGNPFAEPVLIPGNIQGGGIGCFGAYNRSSVKIVLK